MSIVEYPEGSAFPGVIGRTAEESQPGLARAATRPRRAPRTCSWSSSTTPGSGSSAATAAPSRPRPSTRSPPAACASTTCTRRRCARRAAPASSPGATTTPTAWRRSPSSRPASPATTASCRSRTGCSRRCWSSAATTPTWSASGTSRRATRRRPSARTTAGRSGRGFQRFYGFLGGDTSQWNPDLVYDNHQVEPPRTPEEGYHLTEDLVDKAMRVHRRRRAGRPGQALLPAPVLRRDARAAPRAEGVGRQVRRRLRRRLGRLPRARSSPARRSSASCRPTRSSRATTPTCPTGTRCRPTPGGSPAG